MKLKSPSPTDLNRVLTFLKQKLRPQVDWSINNEYPIAFSNFNINNIKFIESEGKILSHALLKYLMIKTPAGIFKVAIIGSVVTDEQHQGKGLAKKLISELVEKAKQDQCELCILWSDLHDFYYKLGFELAGSEEHLTIENSSSTNYQIESEWRFSDDPKINPESIQKIFSKHLVGSVRSNNEIKAYLQIPNSNIYSLWGQNNELLAYAIEGRGVDLGNVVHEWGGGVHHLNQLIAHILKKQSQLQMIASSTAINLVETLKKNFKTTHNTRTLGYMKPLNVKNIHAKVLRWARIQGEYHLQTFHQNDEVYLRYKSKNYRLPNEQALTRLIWGPIDPNIFQNLPSDMHDALMKVFPLPLWVWGWDIA